MKDIQLDWQAYIKRKKICIIKAKEITEKRNENILKNRESNKIRTDSYDKEAKFSISKK